jgi:hypothetical protein
MCLPVMGLHAHPRYKLILVVSGVMKISMKPVEVDSQELSTLPEVGAYDRL